MALATVNTNGTSGPVLPSNVDWIWGCKVAIVILGLIGNLLVIVTVVSSRRLRCQSTYVLTCSLSLIVLYALVAVIPFDIHSTLLGDWSEHLHPKLCAFNAVSAMFFYGSTAINTAMIALERYFATVWYGHPTTNSRTALYVMLAACYVLPLLCLTPFFVHVRSGFDPLSMSCFVTGQWKYDRLLWTVTFLALSVTLMVYCFAHIFFDIRRRKHSLLSVGEDAESEDEARKLRAYFSEVKTVKMAAVLFLLMMLRLPSLLAPLMATRETIFVALNSTLIISLSTIMFYPFVYVLFSREFRQACINLISCRRNAIRRSILTATEMGENTDTNF